MTENNPPEEKQLRLEGRIEKSAGSDGRLDNAPDANSVRNANKTQIDAAFNSNQDNWRSAEGHFAITDNGATIARQPETRPATEATVNESITDTGTLAAIQNDVTVPSEKRFLAEQYQEMRTHSKALGLDTKVIDDAASQELKRELFLAKVNADDAGIEAGGSFKSISAQQLTENKVLLQPPSDHTETEVSPLAMMTGGLFPTKNPNAKIDKTKSETTNTGDTKSKPASPSVTPINKTPSDNKEERNGSNTSKRESKPAPQPDSKEHKIHKPLPKMTPATHDGHGVLIHPLPEPDPDHGRLIHPLPEPDPTHGILIHPPMEADPDHGVLIHPLPEQDPLKGVLIHPLPEPDPNQGRYFSKPANGNNQGDSETGKGGQEVNPQSPTGEGEKPKQQEISDDSKEKTETDNKLPQWKRGDKTRGILQTPDGQEIALESGREGPAKGIPKGTPGFDAYTRTHAEGHAAAIMRIEGIEEARLEINNPTICPNCDKLLPKMLPEGSKLEVVLPDGTSRVYVGSK